MTKNVPAYMSKAFERTSHPYYLYESLFSTPQALEMVLADDSVAVIKKAAKMIADKDLLFFTGNGTSFYDAVAGAYAANAFSGINASYQPSYDFQHNPPAKLDASCAVIGVSHSGNTFETVKALEFARSQGAATIAITDGEKSDIWNAADIVLCNPIVENQGPKTKSFVASILRTHLLALYIAQAKGEDVQKELDVYTHLPQVAKEVLEKNESAIREYAKKRKEINLTRFGVVGTGFQFAPACEGALKMTEAALVHAMPWETEEMIHGHWYSMIPHELVIVTAIEGETLVKSKDLLKGLKTINVDFWVITNSDDEFPEAEFVTRLPSGLPEYAYALLTILPLYSFTYFLALAIGKSHPDHGPYDTQEFMDARLVFRESESYK